MEKKFVECAAAFDELCAPFSARKNEDVDRHELSVRVDERTCALWALRQQATHGDIKAPKENYLDEGELSWMWAWIKGNQKWNAWNECKGMSSADAKFLFIEEFRKLQSELPGLVDEWRSEFSR